MGYLPVSSTFRVRPMHMRGITRCINSGITDVQDLANKCGFPSVELLEESLTKGQKIALGKAKKKRAKEQLAEAQEILGDEQPG